MSHRGIHDDPAVTELERRLCEDLAALEAAVTGLDQCQADWRPGPERWSVGEVLHHLAIANRYFAARIARLIERGRAGTSVATAAARRVWPRLRLIADRQASGPVRNPEGSTPSYGLPVGDVRDELRAAHREIVDQVPAVAGLDLAGITARHPLGFEINLFQWFDAVGAHERRHLAQIEEIKAAPGFPAASEPAP